MKKGSFIIQRFSRLFGERQRRTSIEITLDEYFRGARKWFLMTSRMTSDLFRFWRNGAATMNPEIKFPTEMEQLGMC